MVVAVAVAAVAFLGGLVFLALVAVRTWRRVKALGGVVSDASARIAEATAALDAVAPRPSGDQAANSW